MGRKGRDGGRADGGEGIIGREGSDVEEDRRRKERKEHESRARSEEQGSGRGASFQKRRCSPVLFVLECLLGAASTCVLYSVCHRVCSEHRFYVRVYTSVCQCVLYTYTYISIFSFIFIIIIFVLHCGKSCGKLRSNTKMSYFLLSNTSRRGKKIIG